MLSVTAWHNRALRLRVLQGLPPLEAVVHSLADAPVGATEVSDDLVETAVVGDPVVSCRCASGTYLPASLPPFGFAASSTFLPCAGAGLIDCVINISIFIFI